jgi:hypothetical protein
MTIAHPFRPAADLSKFYVVTVISNPYRFERRYEYYFRFKQMCADAGVHLITVEIQTGLRPFVVTEPNNKYNIQIPTVEILWNKENGINIGAVRAAELGAREVAWVDADCMPSMPPRMWFEETWHTLQIYKWVQMWQWLIDLDLNQNPLGEPQPSFMYNYIKYGSPNPEEFRALSDAHASHLAGFHPESGYEYHLQKIGEPKTSRRVLFGRPGLAWAANFEDFDRAGRLLDFSILGAGDWYMAHGLVGSMHVTAGEHYSPAYAKRLLQWQQQCEAEIQRDVGYVEGTVLHYFHGRKQLRGYPTRGAILKDGEYDPDVDVKYDRYGLLQLVTHIPRQIKMRDRIRAYFKARNEDSTTGGEGDAP